MNIHPKLQNMSSNLPEAVGALDYYSAEYSTPDGLRWNCFIIISFQSLYKESHIGKIIAAI